MFFRIFHKKKEKVEETQIILNICKSLREILYLQSGIKDNSTIMYNAIHYNYMATLWYDNIDKLSHKYNYFQRKRYKSFIEQSYYIINSNKSKKWKLIKARRFLKYLYYKYKL